MSTISQQFIDCIEDALSRGLAQGEKVSYDVSMVAMPGPNGRPQPALGITFSLQAVNLDEFHALMLLLPPGVARQDDVDNMVRQVVSGLIETRAQAANAALIQGNGHKDLPPNLSPSGLILPGQG